MLKFPNSLISNLNPIFKKFIKEHLPQLIKLSCTKQRTNLIDKLTVSKATYQPINLNETN